MATPQLLNDIISVLLLLAPSAALLSLVLAGISLRREGTMTLAIGGGFSKWMFWAVVFLTIQPLLRISIPGGVTRDISPADARRLRQTIASVGREFAELAQMILDTPSAQNRFESTGVLKTQVARDLAVVGPAARASGVHLDVRYNHPYGAYRGRPLEPVTYNYGDVLARARVRIDETAASVVLLDQVLEDLPGGEISTGINVLVDATGFSAVESPRGELLYWIEIRKGRIARCHIKSPSFQNWPALPLTMHGNIIADFPLINKSFNLSYSGCDR